MDARQWPIFTVFLLCPASHPVCAPYPGACGRSMAAAGLLQLYNWQAAMSGDASLTGRKSLGDAGDWGDADRGRP